MDILKKNIRWIVLVIVLIMITSGISVYATSTYLATQVNYTRNNTTINVSDALDELYSMKDNKYTEQEYQDYGNTMYVQGISDTSNSNGYISGITTLNSNNTNSINLPFKPKYVMATIELANGSASSSDIFYYNYNISNTKSYRYNRTSSTLQEFTLGSTSNGMYISNISNTGFVFYAPDIDGRKLYWTAFK